MGQALSSYVGGARGEWEERHDSGVFISNQGRAGMYGGGGRSDPWRVLPQIRPEIV